MNWFPVFSNKGASLQCRMEEIWEQVISRPIVCGERFNRTIRRKVGVVQDQKEDLEATIKGSLGLKGLAQLESTIRSASGSSIRFEEYKEIEEFIDITAPEHGMYLLCYFQKKQIFTFEGRMPRYFGMSNTLNQTVHRWVDECRTKSRKYEYYPPCDEKGTPPPHLSMDEPPDGIIEIVVDGGKLSIETPYRIKDNGIEFDMLGLRAEADISKLISSRIELPIAALPEETQCITGAKGNINALIMQPMELLAPVESTGFVSSSFLPDLDASKYLYSSLGRKYKGVTARRIYRRSPNFRKCYFRKQRANLFAKSISPGRVTIDKIVATPPVHNINEMWRSINALPSVSLKKILK